MSVLYYVNLEQLIIIIIIKSYFAGRGIFLSELDIH
jgi:hypothetical protein